MRKSCCFLFYMLFFVYIEGKSKHIYGNRNSGRKCRQSLAQPEWKQRWIHTANAILMIEKIRNKTAKAAWYDVTHRNQKRSSDFFRNVMSCRIELCEKAPKNGNKNGIWNGHALSSSYAILFFRDIYWISLLSNRFIIERLIRKITAIASWYDFNHWLRSGDQSYCG